MPLNEELIHKAENVLSLYNTRLQPRDYEVTDIDIFSAVFKEWGLSGRNIEQAIEVFFGFFQQQSQLYEDTLNVLKVLKSRKISIGILTDVPYGMRKELVLRDIAPIRDYIDVVLTSVDVGYRKPRPEGYMQLLQELDVSKDEMLYVGNEEKDIIGANRAGVTSVLMNRERKSVNWGQQWTISSLSEIPDYGKGELD